MPEYVSIFVMPTEEGMPPRAVLGIGQGDPEEQHEMSAFEAVLAGTDMALFSNDMGCWLVGGQPVPPELSDAISEHARDLGVPGF